MASTSGFGEKQLNRVLANIRRYVQGFDKPDRQPPGPVLYSQSSRSDLRIVVLLQRVGPGEHKLGQSGLNNCVDSLGTKPEMITSRGGESVETPAEAEVASGKGHHTSDA